MSWKYLPSQPSAEHIVPLELAKAQCRVLHDYEDKLIAHYVDTAIEYIERVCDAAISPRPVRLFADTLPASLAELPVPRAELIGASAMIGCQRVVLPVNLIEFEYNRHQKTVTVCFCDRVPLGIPFFNALPMPLGDMSEHPLYKITNLDEIEAAHKKRALGVGNLMPVALPALLGNYPDAATAIPEPEYAVNCPSDLHSIELDVMLGFPVPKAIGLPAALPLPFGPLDLDPLNHIPKTLKQAILLLTNHWYEHRSEVSEFGKMEQVPAAAEALIHSFRTNFYH